MKGWRGVAVVPLLLACGVACADVDWTCGEGASDRILTVNNEAHGFLTFKWSEGEVLPDFTGQWDLKAKAERIEAVKPGETGVIEPEPEPLWLVSDNPAVVST